MNKLPLFNKLLPLFNRILATYYFINCSLFRDDSTSALHFFVFLSPSFRPINTREHQNRSLVYFSPTFCLIFVNMPLRLAAWLLSLASSNIVLIKNRWEANRHSKPETETGRASWNSNEDARLQSAIFPFALRRLSPIELFVQVCYFLH